MTTHIYLGNSISVRKVLTVQPGSEEANLTDKTIKIGLGSKLLEFTGWVPAQIAEEWNLSEDPLLSEITVSLGDSNGLVFTHDVLGADFELTVLVDDVEASFVSEIHTLTFQNNVTGGTFTITFDGQTTGAITYNSGNANTTATNILNALEALSNIQIGDVQVTPRNGTSLTVFDLDWSSGQYVGTDVPLVTVDYTNLTGGNAAVTVTTSQQGNAGVNEVQVLSMPGYDTYTGTFNEKQSIAMSASVDGGTFTLTVPGYGTTGNLPWNLNRNGLKAALTPILGAGNFIVTGAQLPAGILQVEFVGSFVGVDVPVMTANSASLTASTTPSVQVTPVQNGYPGTSPSAAITTLQNGATGTLSDLKLDPTDAKYTSESNKTADPTGPSSPTDELRVGWDGTSGPTSDRFIASCKFLVPGSVILNWVQNQSDRDAAFLRIKIKTYDPSHNISMYVMQNIFYSHSSPVGANWSSDALFWSAEASNAQAPAGQYYGPNPIYIEPETGSWDDGYVINIPLADILDVTWGSFGTKPYGYSPYVSWPPTYVTDQIIRFTLQPSTSTGTAQHFISFYDFDDPTPANRPCLVYGQGVVGAQTERQQLTVTNAASGGVTLTLGSDDFGPINVGDSATTVQSLFATDYPGTAVTGGPVGTTPVVVNFPSSNGNLAEMTITGNTLSGQPQLTEIQDVRIVGYATGGGVILETDGGDMAELPFNATASEAQAAASAIYPGTSCTGGPWPAPIRFTFPALFGNLGTMTFVEDLDSVTPLAIVGTLQDGGTYEASTITGGTFSLKFQKTGNPTTYTVTGIPWNVSASELQTRINAVLGNSSVTCTGGPLPADITVTFGSGWGLRPIESTVVILSLSGNFGAKIDQRVVRSAKRPERIDHVWNFTVIPGYGTLALDGDGDSDSNWVTLKIETPERGVLSTSYLRWTNLTPLRLQLAINELFGREVCRVVQTGHSQEWAEVDVNYGESEATTYKVWYFRDVFTVVFVNEMADPASITDITVEFPPISGGGRPVDSREWMKYVAPASAGNYDDLTNESSRVYLAFRAAREQDEPIDILSWERGGPVSDLLSYRYKLINHYITDQASYNQGPDGNQTVESLNTTVSRALTADMIPNMKVKFQWKRNTVSDPFFVGTQSAAAEQNQGQIIAETPLLDWDSQADVFQYALENLLSGDGGHFFGEGNVIVSGSLFGSWFPEDFEGPEEADSYNDLRVVFTGRLAHLPFNELQYGLTMVIAWDSDGSDPDPEYAPPLLWKDVTSVPLPPLRSERQRIKINEPDFPSEFQLGYGGQLVTVSLTDTAEEISTKVNALSTIGHLPYIMGQSNRESIPYKWTRGVTVYGTNLTYGLEFEFGGNGFQYTDVDDLIPGQIPTETPILVMTTTVEGVLQVPEIQVVSLSGRPWTGQFRLVHSGNNTALLNRNATAGEIKTALEALVSLGGGSITSAVGGPLMDDDVNATQGPVTLTFAQSLNNVAQLTVTGSTLKNVKIVAVEATKGGKSGGLVVYETVRGNGPYFYDCPDNWDSGEVPGTDDIAVIDDATQPIKYGLRQRTIFGVETIGTTTRFKFKQNRRTFLAGQKVKVRTDNADDFPLPAGLTDGGTYYIINSSTDHSFQLSTTKGGSAVVCTTAGTPGGLWTVGVENLTINQYARFSGQAIGLPRRRSSQSGGELEYLAQYLEAGFTKIELGIDEGNGLQLGRFFCRRQGSEIIVRRSGNGQDISVPAIVFLSDNDAVTLVQVDGQSGIAVYAGDTSKMRSFDIQGGDFIVGTLELSGVDAFWRVAPNARARFLTLTINGVPATLSN